MQMAKLSVSLGRSSSTDAIEKVRYMHTSKIIPLVENILYRNTIFTLYESPNTENI